MEHRCNVKRCGHTGSTTRCASRHLPQEGIAKGCLRRRLAESPRPSQRSTRCGTPSSPDFKPVGTLGSSSTLSLPVTGDCENDKMPSPTAKELTDAALLKSQDLLEKLSSLDLETVSKAHPNSQETQQEDLLLCQSPKESCQDVDSIQVPTKMMKMLVEMWEQLQEAKSGEDKPKWTSPDKPKWEPMRCSLTSSASTASTRSDSCSSQTPCYHRGITRQYSSPRSRSSEIRSQCQPIRRSASMTAMRPASYISRYAPASAFHVHVQSPRIPQTMPVYQPVRSRVQSVTVTTSTTWVFS